MEPKPIVELHAFGHLTDKRLRQLDIYRNRKLRACYTRQFFLATCNVTMTNENHCKLHRTCYTRQLVSQRCQKYKIVLLFLQLATQHFVALQVAKTGCYTGNCFRNLQRNKRLMRCKLQEKLPRVIWSLNRGLSSLIA